MGEAMEERTRLREKYKVIVLVVLRELYTSIRKKLFFWGFTLKSD